MTFKNKPVPLPSLADNAPEWLRVAYEDIAASGSIAATAKRAGIDRSALSQVINQTPTSKYVTGECSTDAMASKIMHSIGRVVCPFLTEQAGEARSITGIECRSYAYRTDPPTNSPRATNHWRACQSCNKRVKPAAVAIKKPVIEKPIQKIGRAGPVNNEIYGAVSCLTEPATQQAGVIDTVTLPLPEVGGPQIAETTKEPA